MKSFLVFLLYLFLTIIVTWPLATAMDRLIIDPHDGLLITWYLNWDIRGLLTKNFFDANIFFPYKNTLAFSDFMLPQAILAAPFVILFKAPLLAYNLNFLGGFVLTAFSMFWLVKGISKNYAAGFLAGILAGFSSIHLNYMAHLQVFNVWPVIMAIHFYLNNNLKLYWLLFVISGLTTPLFVYFLGIFYLTQPRNIFKWLMIPGLLVTPFLIPYFLVSKEFNYSRPITDAINFSLQIPDLINIGNSSRLSGLINQIPGYTPGWLGAGIVILLVKIIWKIRLNAWTLLSGISFILALGPALHIFRETVHVGPIPAIPLPYTIFYYLVPGWAGFRTASRWIILAFLALIIYLTTRQKIKWPWMIIICLVTFLEINFPFKYYSVPPVPPEQEWLVNNFANAPIVQFPIYRWDDADFGTETLREYYSIYHWHPMYNGYSGFSPPEWEKDVRWLQANFPSESGFNFLRQKGIKLVLAPSSWKVKLDLVAEFPNTKIYKL